MNWRIKNWLFKRRRGGEQGKWDHGEVPQPAKANIAEKNCDYLAGNKNLEFAVKQHFNFAKLKVQ